ncbi:MAG TPA: Sec-independent protein translocase protein TatB [Salinarimonas sp.]|jgi:sec-independent protein translocase protein TatB|nr:Sec-independent protein translocase protein TatB [Salinarimonas sp.]
MFDMSWGEMLIIGGVALIVIGPKDLPKALRTIGQMVGKVRRMAGEFQGQFQEAMREAELDGVRKDIDGLNRSVSSFDPVGTIRNEIRSATETPPAATVAAAETAAFAGTGVTPPSAANAQITDAPQASLESQLPPPEPAPPIDLAREFDPGPAALAPEPPPEPAAPAALPEAEPRRAKA